MKSAVRCHGTTGVRTICMIDADNEKPLTEDAAPSKPSAANEAVTKGLNFGQFLLTFPGPLHIERDISPAREVDFGERDL